MIRSDSMGLSIRGKTMAINIARIVKRGRKARKCPVCGAVLEDEIRKCCRANYTRRNSN